MALKESGEMYLETIYVLSKKTGYVRSVDVGEKMGYSKPSVSRAVALLKKGNYIDVDENGHLTLTESGKTIAEKINGALYVDMPDTQVQLLINGTGGNEWTITRY